MRFTIGADHTVRAHEESTETGVDPIQRSEVLRPDLVAWIIPKNVLSLCFSTLG